MSLNQFLEKYQKLPIAEVPNKIAAKPLISICVQTYQHANYIGQCLDGILMQKTNFQYEVLLGEDDSTDGTREICINYAEKYPDKLRLFLHHRENNISINGQPTGRFNFLYNLYSARGKYIAFCEGDDYWTDPYKLQKQVDFLEANPEYAGSFHETQVIFDDGSLGKIYGRDAALTMHPEATIATGSPFHTSSFVFKRNVLQIPEWFYTVVSGDMALFSIMSASGLLRKIPEIMSVYRKHAQGLTNSPAVINNFHKDRIKLINHLDGFHHYKYHMKAKRVIDFHQSELSNAVHSGDKNNLNKISDWTTVILPEDVKKITSMLSAQERQLLYMIARDYWKGTGVIVDAGCFVGGSTLSLSKGILANRNYTSNKKIVYSCDLFVADRHQCENHLKSIGNFKEGDSIRDVFNNNTSEVSSIIEVYEGDIRNFRWNKEKIEVLFIDVAKSWELNDYLISKFFPYLIRDHSIIIQQDFVHPTCPWLAITMEFFSEYFEPIDFVPNNTIVFKLIKEIPAALISLHVISQLTSEDKLYLMDKALFRYKKMLSSNDMVELECARCILKLWLLGQDAAEKELHRIRNVYANLPRLDRAVLWVEQRISKLNKGFPHKFKIIKPDNFLNPVLSPENMDLYIVRSSILQTLNEFIPQCKGVFLDIGCGEMPYKSLILPHVEKYIGLDIENHKYQKNVKPDIFWDGRHIPLDDNSVDCAMATELFEHVTNIESVLNEIKRVLKPGGSLFFTVPFLWPLHDNPQDEYRYTPFSLKRHFQNAGFSDVKIEALGGWDASLAQMIGLWVRRSSMTDEERILFTEHLYPFYQVLLERENNRKKPSYDDMLNNSVLITGLYGTAIKRTKIECKKEFMNDFSHLNFQRHEGINNVCQNNRINKPVLAIISPYLGVTSETFIRKHIDYLLPGRTVVLTGGILDEQFLKGPIKIIPQSHGWSRFDPTTEADILNFLHEHNVTHILCEYACEGTGIVELNQRKLHLPIFVHYHGYDASQELKNPQIVSYYKWMGRNVTGVVAVSEPMARRLKCVGIPDEKIKIVHYGVSVPDNIASPEKAPCRFISVTRLVAKKGVIFLLKSFKQAKLIMPEITLDIIGDGPLRKEIELFLLDNDLNTSVYLHGKRPNNYVLNMLLNSNVYVQHSITDPSTGDAEGLPNSILEAAACGLPVVSTLHEGIPEAVEHEITGFLVDEFDIDKMAKYLILLAQDAKLRKKMGLAGRSKIISGDFTICAMINNLRDILGLTYSETSITQDTEDQKKHSSIKRIETSDVLRENNGKLKEELHPETDSFADNTQNKQVFFSICIPTYNRVNFISNAIQSALNQTHDNYEIVVVDDGSTDNTKEIVESFNSSKIRYILKDHNGAPQTRNRAIEEARGEFILWLDSDDTLMPDVISDYTRILTQYTDADVLYGNLLIIDEIGNIKRELNYPDYYKRNDQLLSRLILSNSIPNPGTLVRKGVYERFGGYDLEFRRAHDYEFWGRIANKANFKHVETFVCKWRWHDNNMSSGSVNFDTSYDVKVIKKMLNSYTLKELFPSLSWKDENGDIAKAYFIIANEFTRLKGYSDAIMFYKKSIDMVESATSYNGLGIACYHLGDYKKSMEAFKEALRLDSHSSEVQQNIEYLQKHILINGHQDKLVPNHITSECIHQNLSFSSNSHYKILLVVHNFPPNWYAGVEIYTFDFAKTLIKKGYDVSVLYPQFDPTINSPNLLEDSYDGIKIFKLLVKQTNDLGLYVENKEIEDIFRNLLHKVRFEIIHFQHTHKFLPFSLLNIANETGIPVCLTLHDFWLMCPKTHLYIPETHGLCEGPESVDKCVKCWLINSPAKLVPATKASLYYFMAYRQEYVKELIRTIDIVSAPSEYLANKFNKYGFGNDKIIISPLGLNPLPKNTRVKSDKLVFGCIGTFHKLKNVVFLAKAFKQVEGKAELLFWGAGESQTIEFLKEEIREDRRLRYFGGYSQAELPQILSNIDLMIVPSIIENYPLAVREAISAGIPVLASNVGGIPEIITHMKNGILFNPSKKEELQKRIQELVDDPSIVDKLKSGISPVKTMEEDVDEWIKRYKHLLNNKIDNGISSLVTNQSRIAALSSNNNISDKTNTKISIIIPVFNKIEFTRKCIEAIVINTPKESYEVIIIDNASTDGTRDFLKCLEGDVKIITNEKNLGFARACNQGARMASTDYLLFLNNDTEPKKGWLEPLLNILTQDNSAGAAGSKLLFTDGTIQHAGVVIFDDQKLPDPLVGRHIYYGESSNLPEANQLRTYQALTAACLLIRKSAFNEVEGFDEGYWNGYEDVDLCFKLQERGWKLVYQPESVVIHHESKSGPERFSKVSENIQRLHSKWIGKIKPDIIIKRDGSTIITENNRIQRYHIPNMIPAGSLAGKPQKLVSIIILTYNAFKYTRQCISSIQQHTSYPHEIIFVDNGSTDGTVEYLRILIKECPHYKLIENQENKGFAAGNNQGVAIAGGEYVMLLNNDVLVSDGWLEGLVESLERDENIGMVGPITNSISGRQMVKEIPYTDENGFHIFAQRIRKAYYGRLTPRYRIAGFAVLMRKVLYEEAGGLEESFGTGNYEDDDLCLKIREKGYAIMVDESVYIHHYRSQTFIENKVDYRNSLSVNKSRFSEKWPNVDYEQLLELHSNLVDVNATLVTQGQQALESGNIGGAIELYSKVLKTNPVDEVALYGIGLAYQTSGKMDDAIDAYKKVIKTHSRFYRQSPSGNSSCLLNAYHNLALVYANINQTDNAISTLKKAIELHDGEATVYNNLGVLYFKRQMPDDARVCFEKALALDATYKEAQHNLEKVLCSMKRQSDSK